MSKLYAGIELGGTKTVWALGTAGGDTLTWGQVPTSQPEGTLAAALAAIEANLAGETLKAIGIGAFGPVDVDVASSTYGTVLNTPKPGWSGADIRGIVARQVAVPVAVDTDVNAAALGELVAGAGTGLRNIVYLTVGTGIGGGAVSEGRIVHGTGHPEMGHMYVPLHPDDLDAGFHGSCPYHDGCLEGLASGAAIAARVAGRAETLPEDHPVWELEAHYVSRAIANLVFSFRPQVIIAGGGVMNAPGLRERIRSALVEVVNSDYVAIADGSSFVAAPGLGQRSGVVGALVLAAHAVTASTQS